MPPATRPGARAPLAPLEADRLETQVERFFAEHPRARLVGTRDWPLTDATGSAAGVLRVVAYEEEEGP